MTGSHKVTPRQSIPQPTVPVSAQSLVPEGSERPGSPQPVRGQMRHIHGTECDSAAKEDRPRVRAPALRTPGSVVLGKEENIPHGSSSTKFKNRPGLSGLLAYLACGQWADPGAQETEAEGRVLCPERTRERPGS